MNKQEMIKILKEANILDELADGPTAFCVSRGKKNFVVCAKQADDYIVATTGNILKRTFRIPIQDIKE